MSDDFGDLERLTEHADMERKRKREDAMFPDRTTPLDALSVLRECSSFVEAMCTRHTTWAEVKALHDKIDLCIVSLQSESAAKIDVTFEEGRDNMADDILDVLDKYEREGQNEDWLIKQIRKACQDQLATPSPDAAQVPHGVCRADDPNREAKESAASCSPLTSGLAQRSGSGRERGEAVSVSDDRPGARTPDAASIDKVANKSRVAELEMRHQADWNDKVYSESEAATLAARHCDEARALAYQLEMDLDCAREALIQNQQELNRWRHSARSPTKDKT